MNEIQQFWKLVEDSEKAWPDCPGTTDLEPYFLKVLELVKSAPTLQPEFARCFIEYLERAKYDYQLLVFCMRELQWPEVRLATETTIHGCRDWRVIPLLSDVLRVYDAEWDDADLWNYYSK